MFSFIGIYKHAFLTFGLFTFEFEYDEKISLPVAAACIDNLHAGTDHSKACTAVC